MIKVSRTESEAVDTYGELDDGRLRLTILQVKNSFLNFLSSTLIPVLSTDITTGTSCNVHLGLVTVVTVGALPNELAVVVLGDFYLSAHRNGWRSFDLA